MSVIRRLYHYRNLLYGASEMMTFTLRMSRPSVDFKKSDPNEIWADPLPQRMEDTICEVAGVDAPYFIELERGVMGSLLSEARDEAFTISLTDSHLNSEMWYRYGDDLCGICIGYDRKALKDYGLGFRPVTYIHGLSKLTGPQTTSIDKTVDELVFLKDDSFANEREFRHEVRFPKYDEERKSEKRRWVSVPQPAVVYAGEYCQRTNPRLYERMYWHCKSRGIEVITISKEDLIPPEELHPFPGSKRHGRLVGYTGTSDVGRRVFTVIAGKSFRPAPGFMPEGPDGGRRLE